MKASEFKLRTKDNVDIHTYEWFPDDENNIKGIVQIAHGMAEHAKRYSDFASFLTRHNYAVFANDHRGHGQTAGKIENLGYFGPNAGWETVVSDMKLLSDYATNKYPKKPFFILGHSMGSFLTRQYVLDSSVRLNGALLSGTGGKLGLVGRFGIFTSRTMMLFYPEKSPGNILNKLSFSSYNKKFKPEKSFFAWLSRDKNQVEKFMNDPYCGVIMSIRFFYELINGIMFVNDQKNINLTPQNLPILLFSGTKDPVGLNGKGVQEVYKKMKKAGVKDVTLKLYEEGRHEMLNEINKDEVYQFVLNWMEERLS